MKKRMALLFGFLLFSLSACDKPATQENVPSPTPVLTSKPQPTESTVPSQPPTREGELQIDVTYHPVVVDGLTEVKAKEGEGIELDLDGDGIAEQMYVCGEGIFVNGKRQLLDFDWPRCLILNYRYHPWETYWIVDIDPTDAYYNLIFEIGEENPYMQEVLVCYAGAIIELGRSELLFSDGFSGAAYYGDGTFQMTKKAAFMGIQYAADVECYLKDGKKIVEKVPDVDTQLLEKPVALRLLEGITMFLESSVRSETIIVEPQEVLLIAIEKRWGSSGLWGLFRLEDGTEAWLYVEEISDWMVNEERLADEIFSGFPNVP